MRYRTRNQALDFEAALEIGDLGEHLVHTTGLLAHRDHRDGCRFAMTSSQSRIETPELTSSPGPRSAEVVHSNVPQWLGIEASRPRPQSARDRNERVSDMRDAPKDPVYD